MFVTSGRLNRTLVPLAIFTIGWVFYCYLSVRSNAIGLLSDTYIYMLLADYFSPFRFIDPEFATYLLESYSYPPGYPIVLGLLGGGSDAISLNYVIDAGFLAATISLFYVWLKHQENSAKTAAVISVTFLALPITLLSSLGIFSEHLYMLVIFVAAILLSTHKDSKALYTAAILVGFATLVRSVGIAAIAAIIVFSIPGGSLRKTVGLAACALLPSIAWAMVKSYFGFEQHYSASVYRGDLQQTMLGLVHQLPINMRAFWHHFQLCVGWETSWSAALVTLLLLSMGIGFLLRLRRLKFDAFYVLFYLLLIFAWPYPNHFSRFIYVVLPFLLFFGYVGLNALISTVAPSRYWQHKSAVSLSLFVAIVAVLAAAKSFNIVAEIAANQDTEFRELARSPHWHLVPAASKEKNIVALAEILNSMTKARELVPNDACISSGEPHFIHYFAQRRSVKPAAESTNEETFDKFLSECPFVFMMSIQSFPPSDYPAMYPFQRIKHAMTVIDVAFFEGDLQGGTVRSMLSATGEARNILPDD